MCALDDDRACQLVGNDGRKQRMQAVLAKYCSSRSGLCHPSECGGDQACKCHYDSYHWPEPRLKGSGQKVTAMLQDECQFNICSVLCRGS